MSKPSKLLSLGELSAKLTELRKGGNKIVLANGCFDLIHVGHIRYLREAKQKGDVLVVAINSDSSVRQNKGEVRPILNQMERAEIVSAFEFVDFVIIFNESTVASLLRSLKPDIHCKGTDYTPHTVPEREVVKQYGGEICIVGDPKNHSSRDFIKNILRKFSSNEPIF